MNSSHSTAWMRACCSTRTYRGDRDSFAGIIVGAVRTANYNLTRNSAVADKPRDAFAQYAIASVADPLLEHAHPHIC